MRRKSKNLTEENFGQYFGAQNFRGHNFRHRPIFLALISTDVLSHKIIGVKENVMYAKIQKNT